MRAAQQQIDDSSSDDYDQTMPSQMEMEEMQNRQAKAKPISNKVGVFDPPNARFPFCITWTPLPCITWFLPMIGHTGICDSEGVIHDFAGPYYVSIDDFAFGETHKYVELDIPAEKAAEFNKELVKADRTYRGRMHNLFCDNCHSHVARALNNVKYQGKTNWNMVTVWWLVMTQGKYVSWGHVIATYIGFIVILAIYSIFKFT